MNDKKFIQRIYQLCKDELDQKNTKVGYDIIRCELIPKVRWFYLRPNRWNLWSYRICNIMRASSHTAVPSIERLGDVIRTIEIEWHGERLVYELDFMVDDRNEIDLGNE